MKTTAHKSANAHPTSTNTIVLRLIFTPRAVPPQD
jgi:hypothetical protein